MRALCAYAPIGLRSFWVIFQRVVQNLGQFWALGITTFARTRTMRVRVHGRLRKSARTCTSRVSTITAFCNSGSFSRDLCPNWANLMPLA